MSDEAFEKWYHTTDDKDQLSEYIFDAAKQAWDEATRQADESWKAYLFAGYEDARPDTDEKGTNVLAHDVEVEKEVKARMRKPLPAEICKRGHPGACLVEAEVAPRPYPGGVFEHTNLRICSACRDVERERLKARLGAANFVKFRTNPISTSNAAEVSGFIAELERELAALGEEKHGTK